jgi:hypothetical protein
MTKPAFQGKNFTLWIEDGGGKFVPVGEISPASGQRDTITCVPTPCKGGFEYVPDWWGITRFG